MTVTIYHNPRCSKSRQTLALLEEKGAAPKIVDYLKTPPSAAELKAILKKLGLKPQDIVRKGEARYAELELKERTVSDDELIELMVENPILIERPLVETDKGVRIDQAIYVERDSQKKIIIGKRGETIKAISTAARKELTEILEKPVHLFLFVKVRENWVNDPERYREMGLEFPR